MSAVVEFVSCNSSSAVATEANETQRESAGEQTVLSRAAANQWQGMTTEEKMPYVLQAEKARADLRQAHPDYRYPVTRKSAAKVKVKRQRVPVSKSIPTVPQFSEQGSGSKLLTPYLQAGTTSKPEQLSKPYIGTKYDQRPFQYSAHKDQACTLLSGLERKKDFTVLDIFAARYLPALSSAYESTVDPTNIVLFHRFFVLLSPSGFVRRFMRTSAGSKLYVRYAHRMADTKLSDLNVGHEIASCLHVRLKAPLIRFTRKHGLTDSLAQTQTLRREPHRFVINWLREAVEISSLALDNPTCFTAQGELESLMVKNFGTHAIH
ncbi:hypothetical protein R3P38DRAFT_2788166 [Favolaschia claudopus]|uniref:HMG box domain-containing protein n=1 Tax=Favolaschia claudopus TaxID=2862362 RepID=A0AAW0APB2_9AGAR